MIRFACPGCQKVLKAPPEKAGIRTACPACKHPLQVPAIPPGATPDPPRPPAGPAPVARPVNPAPQPPDPAAGPPRRAFPPRATPVPRVCGEWPEFAAALAGEDEGDRPVEPADPVVQEVRRRLDQYAAGVPHHRLGRFGSEAEVRSVVEGCVYAISLGAVFETRRLGRGESPYLGWKIPAGGFSPEGLDLWDFRYRSRPTASGRSEHIIPPSQEPSRCDPCTGRGKMACPTCRGGRAVACTSCRGGGTEACGRCGGRGLLTVRTGTVVSDVRCPAGCTAGWFGFANGHQTRCYECNGRGIVSSSSDDYGEVPCPCRTGTVPCSTCGGNRQVSCSDCTGTGTAKCGRCGGGGQVVRYATVVRSMEQDSRATTTHTEGWDQQVVDLLASRTHFAPVMRVTAVGLPHRPPGTRPASRLDDAVTGLLGAIGSRVTTDCRVASVELAVSRTTALRVEYEYDGRGHTAWLMGPDRWVHAPTSPVTEDLAAKLRAAGKRWRHQERREAVALIREAVAMAERDGYCRARLEAERGTVADDLWQAAANPGVLGAIGEGLGKLFGKWFG